jgi:hypothetical protein
MDRTGKRIQVYNPKLVSRVLVVHGQGTVTTVWAMLSLEGADVYPTMVSPSDITG